MNDARIGTVQSAEPSPLSDDRLAVASDPPRSRATASGRVPASAVEISVVLPIYNERDNLAALFDELERVLAPIGKSYEIIAVDDGSRDGTSEILRGFARDRRAVKLIEFRRNCGQTAAFDAGFRHAGGQIVVTMDADLQNDPSAIPAMIAKLEEGFDVVTGWRRNRRDGLVLRKVPSRIANAIIRGVTGTKVHDLGCSLKVYRREITEELDLYGEMHRFIAVLAEGVGARVAEVEVNHRARTAGSSKYGLSRTIKVTLDLITVWFMQRYQTKPIYVFGGGGFLMLTTSGLLSAYVLYEKAAEGIWVHKNPLFVLAVMFALMGVQFLGTGIIAEIIVRTYFESQGKRSYPIRARIGFDPK